MQSYTPDDIGATDAEVLAAATGEHPQAVCPAHRVLLVADAGLGAIDATRLGAGVLGTSSLTVFLNRYRSEDIVHRRNLEWLRERDGLAVETSLEDLVLRILSGR